MLRTPKDLATGLLFMCFGAFVLYQTRTLEFGTARRMGSGYFPTVLAGLLCLIGLVLIVRSFWIQLEPIGILALKPLAIVLGSALLFAALLQPAGFVIAATASVLLCCLAAPDPKILSSLLLAVGLAAGSAFVFVVLLGQPIPLAGSWLR